MSTLSQLFPPAPVFTERQLENLSGKVYVVTGATSGVGLELAKILYSKNATVYVCGRSTNSTNAAIKDIHTSTKANGKLNALVFDLTKLSTIRPAAEKFLATESRLDVLFHNAGVMTPPAGSKTLDGYDLELGTNCLAPFLLTRLLQGRLEQTAQQAPTGSVRVVWVSSMVNVSTPEGGVQFDKNGQPVQMKGMENYMQSKAGELLLAHEGYQRVGSRGIVSVSVNPGLMKTGLQRHSPALQRMIMGMIFKGPKFGAYSELFAGLASGVNGGAFYIPWGRKGTIPDHLVKSTEPSVKGPSVASKFYDWCERETNKYVMDL